MSNANGAVLTPTDRWNLVSHDNFGSPIGTSPVLTSGQPSAINLTIQNTSFASGWNDSSQVELGYDWTLGEASPADTDPTKWQLADAAIPATSVSRQPMTPGQTTPEFTANIIAPTASPSGSIYTLHLDLRYKTTGTGGWFSEQGWPDAEISPIQVIGASTPTPTPTPTLSIGPTLSAAALSFTYLERMGNPDNWGNPNIDVMSCSDYLNGFSCSFQFDLSPFQSTWWRAHFDVSGSPAICYAHLSSYYQSSGFDNIGGASLYYGLSVPVPFNNSNMSSGDLTEDVFGSCGGGAWGQYWWDIARAGPNYPPYHEYWEGTLYLMPQPIILPTGTQPTPTGSPAVTPTATTTPTFTPTPTPTPKPCWCPVSWLAGLFCPATASNDTSLAVLHTVSSIQRAAIDINLFYAVRDQILNQTVQGQHYIRLYNTNGSEITGLLQDNPDLADEARATVELWQPNLQALVNGQGSSAIITQGQVQAIQTFLSDLSAKASPSLQQTIANEEAQRPFEQSVGMTVDQAWAYLNGYTLTWLPPLTTANPYKAQTGSTIPIEFTLTDFKGNFAADNSVTLKVLDANGDVVTGPIGVNGNPAQGIAIQGKKYHYNFQTTGLADGSYTIEVSYNSAIPNQPATYSIQLSSGK